MQLHLFPIILILHITEYTDFLQRVVAQLRDHRTPEEFCGQLQRDRGCLTCSRTNGCLTCKPRYFFFLVRHDMKQTGLCLLSCPNGYYHTRSRDINKCMKCHLDCDCDFTGNFCTRCKEGQYLHRGKCHGGCPEGLVPDSRLWECIPGKVHCEVDEWNAWGPCSQRGSTCGFKAGEQIRVRGILQLPSNGGKPCSTTSETRECFIRKRKCSGSLHREKQRGRKKKREGENMGESPRLKGEGDNGRKKMRGTQRTHTARNIETASGQNGSRQLITDSTQ